MEREQFEKLVDRVVREAQGVITAKEFCGNVSQAEFELAKAEADLAAAVATEGLFKGEDGWTPVSVRLPEEGLPVLGQHTQPREWPKMQLQDVTWWKRHEDGQITWRWPDAPDYWRRLPEPPKDGKTG